MSYTLAVAFVIPGHDIAYPCNDAKHIGRASGALHCVWLPSPETWWGRQLNPESSCWHSSRAPIKWADPSNGGTLCTAVATRMLVFSAGGPLAVSGFVQPAAKAWHGEESLGSHCLSSVGPINVVAEAMVLIAVTGRDHQGTGGRTSH